MRENKTIAALAIVAAGVSVPASAIDTFAQGVAGVSAPVGSAHDIEWKTYHGYKLTTFLALEGRYVNLGSRTPQQSPLMYGLASIANEPDLVTLYREAQLADAMYAAAPGADATYADAPVSNASPSADTVDLISIYGQAKAADTVFAGARATYLAGQQKLPQGLSGILPAVAVSANSQYNDRNLQFYGPPNNPLSGTTRYNSNSLIVTATQPLFRLQNWITYKQGEKQVSQAEAVFLQAGQDLMVRVAQAYFDVLLAESNLALAAAQKLAFAEQLAQARRHFQVGTASVTDANDAQARHDLAASQQIAARNDVEIKKQTLRQITGRVPQQLAKLSSRFAPALPNPDNVDDWVKQAAISSLQVRAAQAAADIAAQEVGKSRSGHLPTLDAVASYSDSAQGSGAVAVGPGFDNITKYVGLQLALPLYQGGLINSKVKEALANEEKARQDLENAKRTAELITRSAFLGVSNGVEQIKALETALLSSKSSLDSTKRGQEVGVRTQVDVLNSTQQLISTRRDYAQAIYGYAVNVLKLKAAAGTLAEDDLVIVNSWLEK